MSAERTERIRMVIPLGRPLAGGGERYFVSSAEIPASGESGSNGPITLRAGFDSPTPLPPWRDDVARRVADYKARKADQAERARQTAEHPMGALCGTDWCADPSCRHAPPETPLAEEWGKRPVCEDCGVVHFWEPPPEPEVRGSGLTVRQAGGEASPSPDGPSADSSPARAAFSLCSSTESPAAVASTNAQEGVERDPSQPVVRAMDREERAWPTDRAHAAPEGDLAGADSAVIPLSLPGACGRAVLHPASGATPKNSRTRRGRHAPPAGIVPASYRVSLLVLFVLAVASWALVWLALTRPLVVVGLGLALVASLALVALHRADDVMPPEDERGFTAWERP